MPALHTAVGVVFLVPAFVYQWQHLSAYWPRPGGAVKWMGYLATAATLVAVVSGLVLTLQAWSTSFSRSPSFTNCTTKAPSSRMSRGR